MPRGPQRALLDRFGLGDRQADRVGTYSKGMKQKTLIARALIADPELVFLDEPTAGLDPEAAHELMTYIHDLSIEQGRTFFITSHRLEEMESVCTKVGVLSGGRIAAQGAPAEVARMLVPEVRVRVTVAPSTVLDEHGIAALDGVRRVTAVDGGAIVELDHSAGGAGRRARDRRDAGRPARCRRGAAHARGGLPAAGSPTRGRGRDRGGCPMSGSAIWTIAAKDLRESTATGQVLAPVVIVPFVFVVLYPVGLLLALRSMSAADAHELIAKIPTSAFPGTGELSVQGQAAYIATVYLFAGFFLIIPTMVAVVLAANSFAGEKERHTLEGVLYTPGERHRSSSSARSSARSCPRWSCRGSASASTRSSSTCWATPWSGTGTSRPSTGG